MKIKGKLLEKLRQAGIEIEEVERENFNDDYSVEIEKSDIAKFPCGRDFISLRFTDQIKSKDYLTSKFEY